jgi:ADP-ribose pyrophosphatase
MRFISVVGWESFKGGKTHFMEKEISEPFLGSILCKFQRINDIEGSRQLSNLNEKFISSKMIYKGKIINLRVDTVVLPQGSRTGVREIVEHVGGVAVVPVNEKGELLLVRQYRHAAGKTLLEIPAGKTEQGEDFIVTARRELQEETGYAAERLEHLVSFYSSPGFTNEQLHLFLATNLTLKEQNLDDDEFIDVLKIPYKRALEMIWSGEICDAKSITGILIAHNMKNKPAEVF